jgi:toxin ParE1/3/4
VAVQWSRRARAHLIEIFEYVAEDDPQAAATLVERLRDATEVLKKHPRIGRMVPEISQEAVRELIVPPYRVVYFVHRRSCDVLGVYHSRRDLGAILPRK